MTMTKFSRINKQREEITMRVLEDMEKGGNEWKKPWVEASPLPPHNPVSGTQYSGRNFLYTYVYGMMRGYADPRWATEKQIKEMGWKIPENLQNGRGGINDELGVGIEHWGMYAYIPRVKKDGTPLTDKGGTQKFTRVRAVKENGVWGRYRKGDNGKYEFEQLPSGVHPHPECDRYPHCPISRYSLDSTPYTYPPLAKQNGLLERSPSFQPFAYWALVLPNPPAPRSLSGSSSTWTNVAWTHGIMSN